ncbi:DUF4180 domain-containing protein [Algoriphagus aestuariicola]|jgi:hypothetical protein|uniref:DUF4180 domain-containing protein n=1 Tax=Algoriphagus aestuariicola TaxID=1852016 RepID=A0ABS3BWN0_9BACT|nr:DUF4180 domain-containing protein [Algoriphagus aestuariicola]MBN7803482.1 DUF4180 domain-containing protein [Algoriphagus aestuariicola]
MQFKTHTIGQIQIAELSGEEALISSTQDAVDLLGNLYYQGLDRVILHERNLAPNFFDLNNGIAGEILQKFSNYRVRLAIVGDFDKYSSKSLQDFIRESNRGRQLNFVSMLEEALDRLTNS